MSEKLRLQEPIRSPLETPRLITPLPYRSGTSFLAWAIVNNNQPVPDVFSKMIKIAASGRLGLQQRSRPGRHLHYDRNRPLLRRSDRLRRPSPMMDRRTHLPMDHPQSSSEEPPSEP